MITALFMGWTDPVTKGWFPIKKMTWHQGKYHTTYLHGMLKAMELSESTHTLVKSGLIKLDRIEVSDDINISFKPRMPVNRIFSDVEQLARLGLSKDLHKFDAFEYIARSGGYNGGDTYDLFPEVTPDNFGIYHFHFGIGDLDDIDITEYILTQIEIGSRLTIVDGLIYHRGYLLGKSSRYVADIADCHPQSLTVNVEKINHDHYKFNKVICHVQIDSKVTVPFNDPHYQPLVSILTEVK